MDTQNKPPISEYRLLGPTVDRDKGICVVTIEDEKGILCAFFNYHIIVEMEERIINVRDFWRAAEDIFEPVLLSSDVLLLLSAVKSRLDIKTTRPTNEIFRLIFDGTVFSSQNLIY